VPWFITGVPECAVVVLPQPIIAPKMKAAGFPAALGQALNCCSWWLVSRKELHLSFSFNSGSPLMPSRFHCAQWC